jgi:hypothetical protein
MAKADNGQEYDQTSIGRKQKGRLCAVATDRGSREADELHVSHSFITFGAEEPPRRLGRSGRFFLRLHPVDGCKGEKRLVQC